VLTINIREIKVNSISSIGSLNIGKTIVCHNQNTATEINEAPSPPTTQITSTPTTPSPSVGVPPAPTV
jgi:hypothetical protein